tara:strand:- start:296 stop:565 length:270 start_codon:yes stop_codon:yes gene_type:complete
MSKVNRIDSKREDFRNILREINDILENGDVRLDFEEFPSYHCFLDVLSTIVGGRLRDMKATDELVAKMEKIQRLSEGEGLVYNSVGDEK